MAATVTGDGLKLPNRYPRAMVRGDQPYWFLRAQTPMSAPLAASSPTTAGRFL